MVRATVPRAHPVLRTPQTRLVHRGPMIPRIRRGLLGRVPPGRVPPGRGLRALRGRFRTGTGEFFRRAAGRYSRRCHHQRIDDRSGIQLRL